MNKIKIYILIFLLTFLSSCIFEGESKKGEIIKSEHETKKEKENKKTVEILTGSINKEETSNEKKILKDIINKDKKVPINEEINKTIEELTEDFDDDISIESILGEDIMNIKTE